MPVGTPRHVLCGALQLLTFLAYIAVLGVALDAATGWLFAPGAPLAIYLRAAGPGAGLMLVMGLFPIAAKWILIGRWKPRSSAYGASRTTGSGSSRH